MPVYTSATRVSLPGPSKELASVGTNAFLGWGWSFSNAALWYQGLAYM